MVNSYDYYASMVEVMRKEPLMEKTVLFMTSYGMASYGDCKSVLMKMLSDTRFSDWHFVWTLPNSRSGGNLPLDARIQRVVSGSCNFVEVLERAQTIITGIQLPVYYIKRDEQLVIASSSDCLQEENETLSRGRVVSQISLRKVDYFYDGYPLHLSLSGQLKAEVLISLSNSVLGTDFSAFEMKYRACQFICVQHNKEICFRIEKQKYQSFQMENEPEVLEHIVSDELVFCEAVQNAEIVITNRLMEAVDAVSLGISCIFITSGGNVQDCIVEDCEKYLDIAGNWEEALGVLESKIAEISKRSSTIWENSDMERLLHQILSGKTEDSTPETDKLEKELWILPGEMPRSFWEMMRYYKPKKDVSILLRSTKEGLVWKKGCKLPIEKKLYCKIGSCAKNVHGIRTKEIIEKEWERMLGKQSFDIIYAWEKRQRLWNDLYKHFPGKELVFIGKEDVSNILYNNIVGNTNEQLKETEIEGKQYYILGEKHEKVYYLQKKNNIKNISVLFVTDRKQVGKYEKLIRNNLSGDMTFVLIDSYGFLEENKLLRAENVYWLPKNVFPVRLLANAEQVFGYDAQIVWSEDLQII